MTGAFFSKPVFECRACLGWSLDNLLSAGAYANKVCLWLSLDAPGYHLNKKPGSKLSFPLLLKAWDYATQSLPSIVNGPLNNFNNTMGYFVLI
jgi:hypothetical protein